MIGKTLYTILAIGSMALLSVQASAFKFTDRDIIKSRYTFEQVKDALVMNREWVPYPAYSDREGWDAMTGEYKTRFIKAGEKYLDYEWKVVKAMDYVAFETSGDRLIMETPYLENRCAIASLFAAELAEGQGRFLPQIINGVFQFCEMSSWCLSAHLTGNSIARRSLPEKNDNTMAIFQGSTSQLIAWIVYFLHDEMDAIQPEFSKRFRAELKHRELDPYLERDDFWWMGLGNNLNKVMLNNWCPWSAYNAIVCFMLLEDDRDRLAQAVWKSIRSLDQYLNCVNGDGAIDEGPGYWLLAPGKMYPYLDALSRITGGRITVFDEKQIKDMGEYIVKSYVGDGWYVNYGDASARAKAYGPLIYRYGKAVQSEPMMEYAAYLKDRDTDDIPSIATPRDVDVSQFLEQLLYEKEYRSNSRKFAPLNYSWYPETEFHYMADADGVSVAARGGHNGESHSHNDVGNFIFYVDSLPVLIDVGTGTYTRQSFGEERYSVWTMQSLYHNVPQINGFAQKDGSDYRAEDSVSHPDSFSTDIAGAYPSEAKVKSWVRTCSLKGKTLTMKDRFSLDEAIAPNILNFMTWGDVDISTPGKIRISVRDRVVEMLYDKSVFTASAETIDLGNDVKLSPVWGKEVSRISLKDKAARKTGIYSVTVNGLCR